MNLTIAIVHNAYGKVSGEEIAIDNLVALLEKWDMSFHGSFRVNAKNKVKISLHSLKIFI